MYVLLISHLCFDKKQWVDWSVAACTYKLKVKTARARYAGTHDHIKIELSDIRRMTRWIGLSGPGHDLSRNRQA